MAVIGPVVTRLENPFELDNAEAWTQIAMCVTCHLGIGPIGLRNQGHALSIWCHFGVLFLHQVPH